MAETAGCAECRADSGSGGDDYDASEELGHAENSYSRNAARPVVFSGGGDGSISPVSGVGDDEGASGAGGDERDAGEGMLFS